MTILMNSLRNIDPELALWSEIKVSKETNSRDDLIYASDLNNCLHNVGGNIIQICDLKSCKQARIFFMHFLISPHRQLRYY